MKMEFKQLLFVVVLTMLAAIGGYYAKDETPRTTGAVFSDRTAKVQRVIDGDTIVVIDDNNSQHTLRLLSINAPELYDCHGQDSKDALEELIEGKTIRLEKDIEGVDNHGRLLRYVFLPSETEEMDDLFINHMMVIEGYALSQYFSPNTKYRDLFNQAQKKAQLADSNIWSECDYGHIETANFQDDSKPTDPSCTIKGNISEKTAAKTYLLEGCPNYSRTKIDTSRGESYFCTREEAEAAGFVISGSCPK